MPPMNLISTQFLKSILVTEDKLTESKKTVDNNDTDVDEDEEKTKYSDDDD